MSKANQISAPIGYIHTEELERLASTAIAGRGMMVSKTPAMGKVAVYSAEYVEALTRTLERVREMAIAAEVFEIKMAVDAALTPNGD